MAPLIEKGPQAPIRRWRLLPPNADVGWPSFAVLGFLAFLGIRFLQVNPGTTEIVVTGLGVAVFLVAYFHAYWLDDSPLLLIPIAVIAAVGVTVSIWNMGAFVFFFYAAYLAGWMDRGALSGTAILALLCLIVLCHYWWQDSMIYLLTGIIVTASISGSGFQARRLHRMSLDLRASRDQVSSLARAAERERIARELHDALGRELTAIALKADLADRLLSTNPDAARHELGELAQISRSALEDVRRSVQGEVTLDPLREAQQCRILLESAGIAVDIQVPEVLPPIASEKATALGFVLREAVTNVVRHAQASHCALTLSVRSHPATLALDVVDNGRGPGTRQRGQGLSSMAARLADLGGTLEIVEQAGTRLHAQVPL